MPASICIPNRSLNEIDADSTFKIMNSDYNFNSWFSDLDIDKFLKSTLDNKLFVNIDASVVGLLTNNHSYCTLPIEAFNAEIIFCPVNIIQLHWGSFCILENC